MKDKKLSKKTIETVGIVTKVIKETPDTHTVRVTMSNLKEDDKPFTFKPGQFVMVKPVINGKKIPRAYSISSAPTKAESENYIDITVRQTEKPIVSKWLNERKVGEEVLFKGPYGNFYWDEQKPEYSEILLLGAGSGITPLKSIVEYVLDKNYSNRVTLLYSSRIKEDIIFYNELQEFERNHSNVKVQVFLTRESKDSDWSGKRGRISEHAVLEVLKEYDIEKTGSYICGTPSFVVGMSVLLRDADLQEERIFYEKW